MNKLVSLTDRISTWGAWIGGGLLFATAVLIAVEVTLRKVFTISMGGADELSSYALAIACSWSFGFALFRKAHIRIDVLYTRFPARMRQFLDILSLGLFGFYMVMLSYFAFFVLQTTIQRQSVANTPLATPLWIPQILWYVGIAGFTLTIIIILTATVHHLAAGNPGAACALSGASTLEEEIEEESGLAVSSGTPGEKS